MTNEEIQLKLGLDASEFATGLRRMDTQLNQSAAHTEKSFLHAQSSARGFHKVLEQLNDTVPGLGTAFTFLANPITATFTLGATLIGVAREKLKEFNAEMDRQGAEAAKPIWSREQMIALKNEIADAHKEYKEFLKSLHPSLVSAELEAITGEKDETKRDQQARRMQERIASERDAALKERDRLDKEVDELKTQKAKIPLALEATKKFAEEQKKIPIFKKFRSIDPAGGVHEYETNERDLEAEERREIQLDRIVRRLEQRKEDNAERIRTHADRQKQIEASIQEKQKAVEQLGGIREKSEMSEIEEQFYLGTSASRRIGSVRLSRSEGGKKVMDTGTIVDTGTALEFMQAVRTALTNGVPIHPKQGE